MRPPHVDRDVVRTRPLKRSEYDFLVDAGSFGDERLELVRGTIFEKVRQSPPHASAIHRLAEILAASLGERADVRIRMPIALSDDSEPEPDVAVVAPGVYCDAHPTAEQT